MRFERTISCRCGRALKIAFETDAMPKEMTCYLDCPSCGYGLMLVVSGVTSQESKPQESKLKTEDTKPIIFPDLSCQEKKDSESSLGEPGGLVEIDREDLPTVGDEELNHAINDLFK